LPNIVEADTVDTFKRRLDKFWAGQNVILDHKAELTGLTSRSNANIQMCKYLNSFLVYSIEAGIEAVAYTLA